MTTKEFIEDLVALGFTVENEAIHLHASVLSKRMARDLCILFTAYGNTPVEERIEEKFYWRLKGSESQTDYTKYLWVTDIRNYWDFDQRDEATKYTQKEYDEFVKNGLIADIFEKEAIEN